MPSKNLTSKQRRFCEAYVNETHGNGTAAAKMAGYSVKTATATASITLKKKHVRKHILELTKGIEQHFEADKDWMVAKLAKIVKSALTEVTNEKTGITGPFDLKGGISAIELMAKLEGLFILKSEIQMSGSVELTRSREEIEAYLISYGIDPTKLNHKRTATMTNVIDVTPVEVAKDN